MAQHGSNNTSQVVIASILSSVVAFGGGYMVGGTQTQKIGRAHV